MENHFCPYRCAHDLGCGCGLGFWIDYGFGFGSCSDRSDAEAIKSGRVNVNRAGCGAEVNGKPESAE